MRTGMFANAAALSEGGTAADGSYLVPSQTDPSIASLAVIEAAARSLSQVVVTEMDIKLPYQASKTVAAAKAESKDTGTTLFATNVPTFNTTTLTAFLAGDSVPVSWELMQDSKALSQFLTADLNRAVYNYEETKFITGSGVGEPLGYLTGSTTQATNALSINSILDLEGALKAAYYPGASFLLNRQEFNRLRKAQLAANQFQSYITNVGRDFFLDGYPVVFSTAMPNYVASPATTGAVLFGNFGAGWTIGDRGSHEIYLKVLDQIAALQGQVLFLGFRRTDQRCRIQESVQMLTTNA
jgi:HK97 family phage major capsid protein